MYYRSCPLIKFPCKILKTANDCPSISYFQNLNNHLRKLKEKNYLVWSTLFEIGSKRSEIGSE